MSISAIRQRNGVRFQRYRRLLADRQDPWGFIEVNKCDSLLFSSLVGCVPGVEFKPLGARHFKSGQWFRRPVPYKPCYPGHSASSISRDMFVGLAWYAWAKKDLDVSESVVRYALTHGLKMGQGELSRVMMSPGLLSTFAWVSYRLGGPSRAWLRWIPAGIGPATLTDYQAHLQLLHARLRGRLTNDTRDLMRLAKAYAKRDDFIGNALVAYWAGDSVRAEVLLDSWFPEDRLPTNKDHAAPWLWERKWGDDWKPEEGVGVKAHSGGDFLFAYSIMRGLIP